MCQATGESLDVTPPAGTPLVFSNIPEVWFQFQRTTFRVDSGGGVPRRDVVTLLDSPVNELLGTYAQWCGHSRATLALARAKWGINEFDIPMPKFMDLFQEHATAPFFVFQVRVWVHVEQRQVLWLGTGVSVAA